MSYLLNHAMLKTILSFKWLDNFSFFAKKVKVVYIDGINAETASVSLAKIPKVGKKTIGILKDIIKKIDSKNIYLLLSDSLAYTVRFTIPAHIQGSEERTYVLRRISEVIPEELENDDWDYKEQKLIGEEKEVLAFAVVKNKFQSINKELLDLKLNIIAVEPAIISRTRNEDPFIGIALKKDISGQDNKTLNLKLKLPLDTKKS